ncbi:GH25 family lysozyme [Bifidobacterium choloepi]|nr:GH25 family lysozyme [Bifidobacterium choloepi]
MTSDSHNQKHHHAGRDGERTRGAQSAGAPRRSRKRWSLVVAIAALAAAALAVGSPMAAGTAMADESSNTSVDTIDTSDQIDPKHMWNTDNAIGAGAGESAPVDIPDTSAASPVTDGTTDESSASAAGTVTDVAADSSLDGNDSSATTGTVSNAVATNSAATVQLASTSSSVTWGTDGDSKTFTESDGTVFADPAMKVIDVSKWQGTIDWAAVKAAGIDAAIIRVGYCNNLDSTFVENVKNAEAAGVPFGIYLYSYADTTALAKLEATFVADELDEYVTSLRLPIFYDIENWSSWTDDDGVVHSYPTSASAFQSIVSTFTSTLAARGYDNVELYTYLSFANSYLNTTSLESKIGWIAQYNTTLSYTYPNYDGGRGWQYTSSATVDGISGNVDMSAFDEYAFLDVNSRSTAHYSDIKWLSSQGITTGFANGTFEPSANVIRQDMSAFLYRTDGSPSYTASSSEQATYSDVSSSTPHASEIWWTTANGISTGWTESDGTKTFRPTNTVLRQDMAAFLYRLAGSPAYTPTAADMATFTDVTSSTPHAKEIWWCASVGISTGWTSSDGTATFQPTSTVVRADMAAFLHRTYDVMNG